MRKKLVILTLVTVLALPSLSTAASLADLNIQVAELLARVFNLKAQLANINANPTPPETPASPSDLSCLILNRNLAQGDEGFDITNLQLFLARNPYIYPEALITGYFGRATERAVQRFQVSRGIVAYGTPQATGYGVIGPKTRLAMREKCPSTTTQTATSTDPDVLLKPLDASPAAGGTPFGSVATFTLSDSCVSYQLDWGDGTAPLSKDMRSAQCDNQPKEVKVNHIYPRAGIYTVVLRAGKESTTGQLKLSLPVVSYKAIVVGGYVQPFTLTPTEGPAPLSVEAAFTLTHPACTSYSVDWGDTQRDEFEASTFACSEQIVTRKFRHIYNEPGTYDVLFRKGSANISQLPVAEQWIVTVDELARGKTAIEITQNSGRVPLTVTLKMSGTQGHCTSYDVDWGDGTPAQRREWIALENSEFDIDDFVTDDGDFVTEEESCFGSFTRTFTHTYVTYGAYPLRVKLGKGLLKDIESVTHWISVFSR